MRIRDLGVIEEAVLEFGGGFSAVTGETGAGKTMVVQGLALLLGARADSCRVRSGAERAVVEGRFRVDPAGPVATRAVAAGAALDDDVLLITRTVAAAGGSRAYLGGVGVPAALLRELAGFLVALHGQSDQQRLRRPGDQRAALDAYAGPAVRAPLEEYEVAYQRTVEIEHRLDIVVRAAAERRAEAERLRACLAELDGLRPQQGEAEALAAETERLGHVDALAVAAHTAHTALAGDPESAGAVEASDSGSDVLTLLGVARRAVEEPARHDPSLGALLDRITELGVLAADLASDVASYAGGVDADPNRLAAAQDRRAALTAAARRCGVTAAELPDWRNRAADRLEELDGVDRTADDLRAERQLLRSRLAELAGVISTARAAAAERFAATVSAELTELAMPHARLEVAVTQRPTPGGLCVHGREVAFGPTGVDDVELRLRPHRGAPTAPLARSASGGELSRVMLAVEVVLAGADPTGALVFDEIDSGVGGRAAVEVGSRLARLAGIAQVIAVTHLPQVAAYADHHLVVAKSDDGAVTRSGVRVVDDTERVHELSRMLAGRAESALARGHAEELLAAAAADRTGPRAG